MGAVAPWGGGDFKYVIIEHLFGKQLKLQLVGSLMYRKDKSLLIFPKLLWL